MLQRHSFGARNCRARPRCYPLNIALKQIILSVRLSGWAEATRAWPSAPTSSPSFVDSGRTPAWLVPSADMKTSLSGSKFSSSKRRILQFLPKNADFAAAAGTYATICRSSKIEVEIGLDRPGRHSLANPVTQPDGRNHELSAEVLFRFVNPNNSPRVRDLRSIHWVLRKTRRIAEGEIDSHPGERVGFALHKWRVIRCAGETFRVADSCRRFQESRDAISSLVRSDGWLHTAQLNGGLLLVYARFAPSEFWVALISVNRRKSIGASQPHQRE